jgi:hypothetical protein
VHAQVVIEVVEFLKDFLAVTEAAFHDLSDAVCLSAAKLADLEVV